MGNRRFDPRHAIPEDPHAPVPRSRSGMVGRRFPRTGTEPLTARSAVGLRLILAVIFTPLFLAAGVLFAIWAANTDPGSQPSAGEIWTLAITCAVLALLSLLDLTVVLRRLRRERGG